MQRSKDGTTTESEREQILGILASTIRRVSDRIDDYEAETPEDERLLIDWIRALGYLAGQYRKLMKDTDVDEMEDELDLVRAARDLQEGR